MTKDVRGPGRPTEARRKCLKEEGEEELLLVVRVVLIVVLVGVLRPRFFLRAARG